MKISIGKLSKEIGASISTLRRWEREGKLKSERMPSGHRRYNYDPATGIFPNEKVDNKYTVGYCRVSTRNKLDDLERQKNVVELFCGSKGWTYKIIEDVGSGLNYKKRGLQDLIKLIEMNHIDRLVITHKDRLLRFGSEIIFKLCEMHGVEVSVINMDDEKPDFSKELAEDVLSIITVFSAKLYGKESQRNKTILKKAEQMFPIK